MTKRNKNKILYYYSFFQAFPVVSLIFNITFYFFPFLLLQLRKKGKIRVNHYFQFAAILFGIGAIFSTLDSEDVSKSLIVLPNYLYWTFTIIIFYNYRNFIDFKLVARALTSALILLNFYYWVFERILAFTPPGLNFVGENGYAILMICFVPLALKSIEQNRGYRTSVVVAIICVLLGLLSGSRAGSILIAVGSFLTLAGNRLSLKRIIIISLIGLAAYWVVFNAPFVKVAIYALSEETYNLLYQTEDVIEGDVSYLLRKAMVEKGLILFENDPLTGLGLNNWSEYEVEFRGDFAGAERIINKPRLEKFSAHNSYISFLGEGGLLLFIPFILILILTITKLLRRYATLDESQRPILWGLLMMSIHIYFISAMLNSFAWFFIALGGAAAFKKNTSA